MRPPLLRIWWKYATPTSRNTAISRAFLSKVSFRLLILWLLGVVALPTVGGLIHLLLVLALIVLTYVNET